VNSFRDEQELVEMPSKAKNPAKSGGASKKTGTAITYKPRRVLKGAKLLLVDELGEPLLVA